MACAILFAIANSLEVVQFPYVPLRLTLNTIGTAALAVYLVSLIWINHGGSIIFHLFAAGGFLLLAGRVCELPWFAATLGSLGLGDKQVFVASAIDNTLADMGYCVFAWAVASFSINATRHELDSRANEQRLRQSEERYRRMVELTPNWIFETNRAGNIEISNNAAGTILGYHKADIEGKELSSLADPACQETVLASFRGVLSGHMQTDLEIRFPHHDGGFRWLSLNLTALTASDGEVKGVQGDGHDITVRKETADALLRRRNHLSCLADIQALLLGHPGMQGLYDRVLPKLGRTASASRVYVFENQNDPEGCLHMKRMAEWRAEGIPAGLAETDPRGLPYSPTFARWADRLRQGQPVSGVTTEFPESERAVLEPLGIHSILLIPLVTSVQWYGFLGFDNCAKAEAWGVAEVDLFRSVATAISLAIGRIRAEEEMATLERKMLEGQKLESLGVLAGGIAHDFNNLLTTIMGNANLAHDQLPMDSPVRHHLVSIDKATQRAADLAHQMLAYTGHGHLTSTDFDLNETIRELMTLLSASVSKKVILACDLSEDLLLVKGDPTQVRQVIMNLIINAAEAIGEDSGTVTIRTGGERIEEDLVLSPPPLLSPHDGDYVIFEVMDTGLGMDASTLERIFDPFFTTKVTGHGLGLAAVLGIVRSHGGGIRVQSEKGLGTTFMVYLPAGNRPRMPTSMPSKAELGTGSGTVLVVDDEENVRDLVESVLLKGGYRVVTACDGIQAINTFKELKEKVDVIILDLSMPNLSGAEALAEIRSLSTTVPVILSSGFSEGDVVERFSESRPSGFIQKPYRPKDLLDIISQVLPGQPV